jgi:hypothetical protein
MAEVKVTIRDLPNGKQGLFIESDPPLPDKLDDYTIAQKIGVYLHKTAVGMFAGGTGEKVNVEPMSGPNAGEGDEHAEGP